MSYYRNTRSSAPRVHRPGQCEAGSIESLTCSVCGPHYRNELAQLQAADAARIAKFGRKNCPTCGKVYRVTDGVAEEHACTTLTDSQIWS